MVAGPFAHAAFAPYRDTLQALFPLLGDSRWIDAFNGQTAPQVRLVADDAERGALEYEQAIHTCGAIPTRVGALHDLLNAVVWQRFPMTKRLLNAKHVADGAREDSPNKRSPLRDGLTLFDESGVVIVGEAGDLPAAHQAHDWHNLFVTQRAQWGSLQVLVFGHGLLESLIARPHNGLVGKTLWLNAAIPAAQVDGFLSEFLGKVGDEFKAHLRPLPICGVPGWDRVNANPDFYADARVFRPLPTIRV
jgi:Protein of unknown function (DUF3025)